MVRCEMCGTETATPTTVTVEGAELEVCDSCTTFGTEVKTDASATTSTKYSTDTEEESSETAAPTTGSSTGGSSGGDEGRGRDLFDEMDEVAQDYPGRIRQAREERGLSQADLASQLNEKASRIRKLEHGDTLPSDDLQRKLERALDIDLSAGGAATEDAEWEGDAATGSYTLGDVVERRD